MDFCSASSLASSLEMTSALLNLQMDAAVLAGTACLLVYKDFVQSVLPRAPSTFILGNAFLWVRDQTPQS